MEARETGERRLNSPSKKVKKMEPKPKARRGVKSEGQRLVTAASKARKAKPQVKRRNRPRKLHKKPAHR